jgi:VanZ family protein
MDQNKRIIAWMPAGLWAFVILLVSVLPGSAIPTVSIGHFDKVFHFLEYFFLALLLVRGLNYSFTRPLGPKHIVIILILGIGYGIVMELVQFLIPGREPSVFDTAANAAGVLFGTILRKVMI